MEEALYQLPPVVDVITSLNYILGKTENVRVNLSLASANLCLKIYQSNPAELFEGRSPRCKKADRISSDEYRLLKVRDAIETLSENVLLLRELEKAGWDYVNFSKKYDHE